MRRDTVMKCNAPMKMAVSISTAVGLVLFLFALAGCSPVQDGSDLSNTGATPIEEGVCGFASGYEVDSSGLVQTADGTIEVRDYCFTCHNDGDSSTGMDWDAIVKATSEWKGDADMNPHESHLGPAECANCHVGGETVLYCNQCHEMEL